MFRIEAGTKALFIDFGCNFDLVEVGLLLSGFLLLEHPQISHSLKSARYLPHSDTSTQAPTCCLYFCDYFTGIALLDRHFF